MVKEKNWHVRSKWRRHLGLVGNRLLRRHIPATQLLNARSLATSLNHYQVVFVKPVYGSFGNRIMRIARRKDGYAVQQESRISHVPKQRIARTVFQHTRGHGFMLQKGVSLLHVGGRPVDFRVLLLRPNREWEVMGIMGKVATGRRIVTNFNHGGQAVQFRAILRKTGYSQSTIQRLEQQMKRISISAAQQFRKRYPQCRRLGIDIAIDQRQQLWILEVNTNPFFNLFRHHEDKGLYGRIRAKMGLIRRKQT